MEASPPPVASPASPERYSLGGGVLRVKIVEAKGLPAMDVLTGSADPFVVVSLGDRESCKTRVIKKSLHPVWDEEFSFPLSLEAADVLKIEVKDWNLIMSAHSMGECEVRLCDVEVDAGGASGSMWVELVRGTLKECTGSLRLEMSCDAPEKVSDPLPEQWSQHWSKTKSRPYYSHRKTGETRWSRPAAVG